ncbi:prion-like-(Q/N-rich) domain-bearing protein 25 isoform X2 [Uranotaenia lowii]|uniref:prion-like-(Q/N-rich) domain-bearing protein 25 isoform X2 n=1 Tax=Uranotaenia lowii TaxID=190385 RepID=UPI002479C4C8|nr:prion-like-(Q/N-rich) domain-bearing protein 25 isoform X2 [Uranotaenia lowii]
MFSSDNRHLWSSLPKYYSKPLILWSSALALLVIVISVLPGVAWGQQSFVRRTTSVCRVESECPNNAYCEYYSPSNGYGICICRQGYFVLTQNSTRECIRFATAIGDYCQLDDQCQYLLSTDSECRDNSCQCREGTHYVERERRCYKTSYLGQYCRLTNNCIGDDTYCRDGICVCAVGKHPNMGRNLCLPDVYLGEKCFRDEECINDYSRCNDVCRCRVSHLLNRDQNQCLPIARRLYDLCEEDLQCLYNIPYSRCQISTTANGESIGNCTCANGYHEVDYCHTTVYLNGICEVNENCALSPDTVCINGRCRCADHMINVDGQCSGVDRLSAKRICVILITVLLNNLKKILLL